MFSNRHELLGFKTFIVSAKAPFQGFTSGNSFLTNFPSIHSLMNISRLYFTYLLVGNPPRPYYLDIDSGSDLTWIQCDAPCASCAKGANALYKPRRGNIVPPNDSFCTDHSSSMGVLARDEQHVISTNGSLTKFKAVFGCAYDQQGPLLNTLAKTDGILGLSRTKVSLPSQLASQGIVKNVIGHCLSTDINGGGYMFFGDEFIPKRGMARIPMLDKNSM